MPKTHASTLTPRVPRGRDLPIALRLALALGLLLALLGLVIALAMRQSEWVGASSRQLAESGLRQVTLARKAQTEALRGAGYLHTLFLLERQPQRIPIYTLIDRCTAARDAALDALAAGDKEPGAEEALARVTRARQRFVEAFQETVDTVEMDLDAARPLMVERTLPALHEMLDALNAMAELETERAHAHLAEIETLQRDSRQRILELGALAVLVALASAVLITRQVAGPLAQAARLARDIPGGDMHTPLPPGAGTRSARWYARWTTCAAASSSARRGSVNSRFATRSPAWPTARCSPSG